MDELVTHQGRWFCSSLAVRVPSTVSVALARTRDGSSERTSFSCPRPEVESVFVASQCDVSRRSSVGALVTCRKFPSLPGLLRVFIRTDVGFCQILFRSVENIYYLLIFLLSLFS